MAEHTVQTVTVDAAAFRRLLVALNGPQHYIRELQATRGPLFDNPIDLLIEQFNAQISAAETENADQA